MTSLAPIARAIDFIESHLQSPIAVADMAEAIGYSVYHFCRTFNQATHHTPYDYLMRRRLAEAARVLLSSNRRVIDVALDYQFNSPETFSRAFRRVYDAQPSQLRKRGWIDPRRQMPRLTLAHIRHIHQGAYLRPEIEAQGVLRLAGIMTPVQGKRTAIPALWNWLLRELARCEGASSGEQYGLIHYPEDWERHGYAYMAAVEVQEDPPAQIPLALKTLPPQRYARFVHKGATRDRDLTLDYVYHTWLPKSGYSPCPPFIVEHYGQGYHAACAKEGETEIYVPIKLLDA